MGFFIHTVDDGHNPPHEYHPAASGLTPKAGMALKLEGGKLALASGADEVKYISMRDQDTACTEGEIIPVIRAGHDIIFETVAQTAMSGVNVGDAVQIHTDGLEVTATTGGCAEVVYKAGDAVRVRFGAAPAASEAV